MKPLNQCHFSGNVLDHKPLGATAAMLLALNLDPNRNDTLKSWGGVVETPVSDRKS